MRMTQMSFKNIRKFASVALKTATMDGSVDLEKYNRLFY